jgi:hypothetical protein
MVNDSCPSCFSVLPPDAVHRFGVKTSQCYPKHGRHDKVMTIKSIFEHHPPRCEFQRDEGQIELSSSHADRFGMGPGGPQIYWK